MTVTRRDLLKGAVGVAVAAPVMAAGASTPPIASSRAAVEGGPSLILMQRCPGLTLGAWEYAPTGKIVIEVTSSVPSNGRSLTAAWFVPAPDWRRRPAEVAKSAGAGLSGAVRADVSADQVYQLLRGVIELEAA